MNEKLNGEKASKSLTNPLLKNCLLVKTAAVKNKSVLFFISALNAGSWSELIRSARSSIFTPR